MITFKHQKILKQQAQDTTFLTLTKLIGEFFKNK